MTTVSDVFRLHGGDYLAAFHHTMPRNHHKVIDAIVSCRTPEAGATIFRCEACGKHHLTPKFCGNRHCPTCQHGKGQQWLEKRLHRLLPVPHFMLTFTVPKELRPFMRSHQRVAYDALFAASAHAIKKLAPDPKYIGGDLPGFFGVLQTWGRLLAYHPHIHYIVPGGALDSQDRTWHPSRRDFYLPVRALSKICRATFQDIMRRKGLLDKIPSGVWDKGWNVDSEAVGTGREALKYLTPYVFRVAISNNRIVKIDDGKVFFRYRKQKSRRWRTASLEAVEFMRRFLQHILPSGFMKIRYFGFMNPNASVDTKEILERLSALADAPVPQARVNPATPPTTTSPPSREFLCPDCGGALLYSYSLFPLPPPG